MQELVRTYWVVEGRKSPKGTLPMITPNDVLQAMQADNPATTTREAEKYLQQIDKALDRRFDEVAHLLRQ